MFSRYDRDRLAEVINRYLNEELTAFKFDEQLSEIAAGTKDETVKQVVDLFWLAALCTWLAVLLACGADVSNASREGTALESGGGDVISTL